MIKGIMIILLSLTLVGCTIFSKPTSLDPINLDELQIVHPQRPLPISYYDVRWKVIVVDDKPVVGLEYQDSIEFRTFLEDMKRYIQEQRQLLCFYRRDLKESICINNKESM